MEASSDVVVVGGFRHTGVVDDVALGKAVVVEDEVGVEVRQGKAYVGEGTVGIEVVVLIQVEVLLDTWACGVDVLPYEVEVHSVLEVVLHDVNEVVVLAVEVVPGTGLIWRSGHD